MAWFLIVLGGVLFLLSGPLTGEFLKRSRGGVVGEAGYQRGEVPKLVSFMNVGGLLLIVVGIVVLFL